MTLHNVISNADPSLAAEVPEGDDLLDSHTMDDFAISLVGDDDAMREVLYIRRLVFIEEQHVPEALEIDDHDGSPAQVTSVLHVIGRLAGRPIATGRLLLDAAAGERAHLGRVAVLPGYRGHGYGARIMAFLHALARERGFSGIALAAQLQALGFYERLGYRVSGDVFLDAGIEHRIAEIDL